MRIRPYMLRDCGILNEMHQTSQAFECEPEVTIPRPRFRGYKCLVIITPNVMPTVGAIILRTNWSLCPECGRVTSKNPVAAYLDETKTCCFPACQGIMKMMDTAPGGRILEV